MDYGKTLNLPKTTFPMKAGLPKKEPQIQQQWDDINLYASMRKSRQGAPKFILHDGPPYANGRVHMGTALNKVLKDIINKYNYMQGYDIPYVPGWDTHGLPVEHQVIKTQGINRKEISDLEFRRMCAQYALQQMDLQREQFKRMGIVGDWENPYITLKPAYEANQVGILGRMAQNGYIYKGKKPVYWCSKCETALAEAEIEYRERSSSSIYVKFPIVDNKGLWDEEMSPSYILIWTTTPWTIPANLAIAVHPSYTYSLVEVDGEYYLLARDLVDQVFNALGIEYNNISLEIDGSRLEGIAARHPLYERNSGVVLADYVTLEQGTGCVHTAPGHGLEDYETGIKYGLEIYSPLDHRGVFTADSGEFAGLYYVDGNEAVLEALKREKVLLTHSVITHQYPHCWRCKEEVIFRATEQWFASVADFRDNVLKAIKEVEWVPSWGRERMNNMIAERRDWCISRQRVWGVPLPVFYCRGCSEIILNEESIAAVQKIFREKGSDAWFAYEADEILPQELKCPSCGERDFSKEKDIMDVWFDSGSSHEAVLREREELHWPADLYLEGSDQFRGWFQSSLLTSVAVAEKPPYRQVLSHGWVVDGEGKKMSKSLGNVIAPEDIIENYGADILRLWVSSADFTSDVHLSNNILKQLSEVYRKIRNTCRFLLGNCSDFNPSRDSLSYDELEEIDKWALHRLYKLVEKTRDAYAEYEFHQVFHSVHNFAVVDMSTFYLDIIKDRLYVMPADSFTRRAAQTVLAEVLQTITLLVAPVLSFTAEEIWSHIPFKEDVSVMLNLWPELPSYYENNDVAERWDFLIRVKEDVNRALEKARKEKMIGNSLEAAVELYPGEKVYQGLIDYEGMLPAVFIVSSVHLFQPFSRPEGEYLQSEEFDLGITVKRAEGEKCQRCWIYSTSVGSSEEHPELCSRCAEIIKTRV